MDIIVKKPTEEEITEAQSWGTWSKEVSTFDWSYSDKETCLIIKGSATVTPKDGGESATFSAGDYVVFPEGLECTWNITEDIEKYYKFG